MRGALGLAAFAVLGACQDEPARERTARSEPAPAVTVAYETPATNNNSPSVACAADEAPIFSCAFADGKRIAVCGVSPGNAEYRFGGDTNELVLKRGARANAMYSGGGESQLAFANGDTRYIVFSRMVRTGFDGNGNRPAISDGVVVERAGRFAAIRVCADPDVKPVDIAAAEKYIPAGSPGEGGALFTEQTIRADPLGDE